MSEWAMVNCEWWICGRIPDC